MNVRPRCSDDAADRPWTGRGHNLIVFGWSPIPVTDEGDDFEEFRVSVPIQIPCPASPT